MPKPLHQRLREKGWTEEEIQKTMNILYSEEKQIKHAIFQKGAHPILYWTGLVIAIIANFVLAVAFIPFLMMLNSLQVYIILGVVGFVFGSVFNVIIKDIEHIDAKHHIVAGAFIPAIALATVYVMTQISNRFTEIIQNPNPHNPLIVSMIYLVTFTLPYAIYKIKDFSAAKKTPQPV
ncbi:hypothetical protein ACFL0V_06565 [Nanoarchaeota archaeon]